MLVASSHRQRETAALARAGLFEALERGCSRVYVEVVAEQEALVVMSSTWGSRPEALLGDFVRDGEGGFHDLMLLTHRVADHWGTSEILGLSGVGHDHNVRRYPRACPSHRRGPHPRPGARRGRSRSADQRAGANVAMWNSLAEFSGFQVISYDAAGTGRSSTPLIPYTMARAAIVASACSTRSTRFRSRSRLLVRRCRGADAGSCKPDRVRRLVLACTSCGVGAVPGSMRRCSP